VITLTVVILAALAGYLWIDSRRASADSLRSTVSSQVLGPIGQVHLVSEMQPAEPSGDSSGPMGRDPASIPDTRIQVDVAVKLEEMGLPVEPLDITVDDRLVTLEGGVEDMLLRDAIEVTVRSVEGVREVDNRIEVVGGK
jgi:osmotically-inducible protein OsmY